jgi:prefoldin subunit 5
MKNEDLRDVERNLENIESSLREIDSSLDIIRKTAESINGFLSFIYWAAGIYILIIIVKKFLG